MGRGRIVDTAGKVLARHDGIENFTVGQRKGLGFAAGQRRYVLQIIPEDCTVVVGERQELQASSLIAERANWLVDEPPTATLHCNVKIRYRHQAAPATLVVLPPGRVHIEFDEPQSAITPGQAVVFYRDNRVLGGGWIAEVL